MPATHLEFLVEEPSMEAFLSAWLPRYLSAGINFGIRVFQGKPDLINNLENRLRGYCAWMPADWRIVIIIDRDDDNCRELKAKLEATCQSAGLNTRRSRLAMPATPWHAVTCLAIEELEAWYFGDWPAVVAAFPRVSPTIPAKTGYRQPDAIAGGTWEAFERIMQRAGYFAGGLQKLDAARAIGAHIDADRSQSPSFRHLATVLDDAVAGQPVTGLTIEAGL